VDDHDRLAERFETHRPHLRAVAYRMLGSLSDADDAVQEAWLRLSRSDTSSVGNLAGWLTRVVARVCLDMLRARTARREQPLGLQPPGAITDGRGSRDPEQEALLAEEVAQAQQRAAPLVAELDQLEATPPPQARYPYVNGNLLLARAEQSRLEGRSDPQRWRAAAAAWERIGWPFEAGYARFREAEALLADRSSRPQAEQALRSARQTASAHQTAVALGAAPLRREIESLAKRGRLRLDDHLEKAATSKAPSPAASLGLTRRETEVLALVAKQGLGIVRACLVSDVGLSGPG
jgi:RNA polymerase sigma factor (sigma-70 family)